MVEELTESLSEKLKSLNFNLKESEEAMHYLMNERGLTKETIEHFSLGYDKERHAIAIPLFKHGNVIAIKYRMLGDTDKRYDYEKGGKNWIYNEEGLDQGRKKGYIFIVEGEFDCMSMWQAGIKAVCSPASGKDSYGVWIEFLDTIPRIYIAYDNDTQGKETAIKMSERLGTDKCFEVVYPDNIKDANEFFKKYQVDKFKELSKCANPFYKYEFKGVGDIIESLRNQRDETIEIKYIPKVKFEKDWVVMLSGVSNVGKTSFAMNLADDLTKRGVPTLILPFERGIESVGKRFLQVKFEKTTDEFSTLNDSEWSGVIKECSETPIYFALPKNKEILSTIVKSKRLFDTRVVIIDHLDYLIRNVSGNREAEISNTLQALKRVAEEHKILFIIVSHIRKIESGNSMVKRKPTMEDLKGSSSLYQDPEVVVMLTRPDETLVEVNVLKNKGDMVNTTFGFDYRCGKIRGIDEFGEFKLPEIKVKGVHDQFN